MIAGYADMSGFYDFNNLTGRMRENNNAVQRWLADNCKETAINGERSAYGLIGSKDSLILQQLQEDIDDIAYVRDNSRQLAKKWADVIGGNFEENIKLSMRGDNFFKDGAYWFETHEEFFDFLKSPDYENVSM